MNRVRSTRREFLRTAALGAAALALAPRRLHARTARLSRPPNLLFIWTDEQRWDTLAAYGNRRVLAPNLNALAAQSLRFDQAYCTQPVCTASRSSVLTGLWPHQNGCTANNIPLRPDAQCFPQLLGDPDYRTGYIGKWHLGDEQFAQHGFQEWISTEDGHQKFFSPGRDRNTKSDYWHYLIERGYKPGEDGYFSRKFAYEVPVADGKPTFQAGKAKDFLTRHRRDPFVLHVSYLEPHPPYVSPLGSLYQPAEAIPLDDSLRHDDEADMPWRYRLRRGYFAQSKSYDSDPRRQAIQAQYWGNISVADRSVGEILTHLETLGLADNTIVVFTSDHGDQMSAHSLWTKEVMYQESLRVPYLLRIPGGRGGRVIAPPVSHIDLVPTLLDLMGKPVPADLSGQSLAPLVRDERAALAQPLVFAQWAPYDFEHGRAPNGPMWKWIRRHHDEWHRYLQEHSRAVLAPDGWKLSLSDIDKCQLYNLRDDPHEEHNLYSRGGHADVIARLTGEIHRWQSRTADQLKLG